MILLQAAVRSSRRKRNQYVVDLRQNVEELKKRKKEAQEQNNLLRTLTILWERLCSEVILHIITAITIITTNDNNILNI